MRSGERRPDQGTSICLFRSSPYSNVANSIDFKSSASALDSREEAWLRPQLDQFAIVWTCKRKRLGLVFWAITDKHRRFESVLNVNCKMFIVLRVDGFAGVVFE
ncbi:hypothetical protein L596_024821 [Steinernema carpocapsae]|uniref:Uncharacterized protein n=1 Tax=Steinernema carpocapsae TaxID=34508 RepID=A0A4U5M5Y6_STECR|nr:hypothetical protein L596_024821 [Steinernema carpocapsae]